MSADYCSRVEGFLAIMRKSLNSRLMEVVASRPIRMKIAVYGCQFMCSGTTDFFDRVAPDGPAVSELSLIKTRGGRPPNSAGLDFFRGLETLHVPLRFAIIQSFMQRRGDALPRDGGLNT